MGKLENRVAVVTGGNSGIGLAMAKLFAAEGAKVVITGHRQQAIDDTLREIGPDAVGVQGDVGKLADLDRLTSEVKRRLGSIDVHVANAGVNVLSPGPVKTPIIGKLGLSEGQVAGLDEVFAGVIPLGRWGRPEELARAGLFLASDESSFVTGIDLCGDGGMAQV